MRPEDYNQLKRSFQSISELDADLQQLQVHRFYPDSSALKQQLHSLLSLHSKETVKKSRSSLNNTHSLLKFKNLERSSLKSRLALPALLAALACLFFIAAATTPSSMILLPFLLSGLLFALLIHLLFKNRSLKKDLLQYEKIGQYKIYRRLSESSFCEVFLAKHSLLKRFVVVKVVKKAIMCRELMIALEQGLNAATCLNSSNTVSLYDFGRTDDDRFYYTMEFIEGSTVEEVVHTEGIMEHERAIYILRQVLYSLDEAHKKGVLHKNILPSHILLTGQGGLPDQVKVIGYSISRLKNILKRSEANGEKLYDLVYKAPEHFKNPQSVDERSDIYSLAAVAYFMLSGRPIFEAQNLNELKGKILHQNPAELSSLCRGQVPNWLCAVVMSCLDKNPALRPHSIEVLLSGLDTYADPVAVNLN